MDGFAWEKTQSGQIALVQIIEDLNGGFVIRKHVAGQTGLSDRGEYDRCHIGYPMIGAGSRVR